MLSSNEVLLNMPSVSIVIPTYNRADVLRDCLESVVNQTYNNLEVLVINDNSTDNTLEILKEYKSKYSFFEYFNNRIKGGNAARNMGIDLAKGDYIAFMDDDDVCELDRIEKQMRPILSNNGVYDFIISGYYVVDSSLNKVSTVNYKKSLESVGYPQRWLVKKKILEKSGKFDIDQPALQDVEFYWRLKEFANIFFDPTPVVSIRDSSISITKDKIKMINGIKRLITLHGAKMNIYERNIWILQSCKILAKKKLWDEYKKSYNNFNKKSNPFISFLLNITLILKQEKILWSYSKILKIFGSKFHGMI